MWLKLFAQNSSVNDKLYFYGLFGWRFKPPFGALYLIYAHDEFRENTSFPKSDNLFLKLTFPEYGGFEGIITLHDIVESILGAIPEENEFFQ